MRLRWLRSGSQSLRSHVAFLATENPDAAARVRHRIRAAVLRLTEFPQSGRPGELRGTHELIVSGLPYLVVYRLTPDTVEILRVLHTSTNWQSLDLP